MCERNPGNGTEQFGLACHHACRRNDGARNPSRRRREAYESQNNELCAVGAQGEAITTGSVPIEWCAFGCRRYAPR